MSQAASDSAAPALLSAAQLCSGAPLAHRAPTIVRLHHVDARFRIKLRGIFELLLPVAIDTWRQRCAMDALFASGVWPVLAYYDAELAAHPLAPGHASEITATACLGRVPERALVLAGELSLFVHRGTGQLANLRDKLEASVAPEFAARLRFMANLIQPFKPASEFVLRDVPPELSELSQFPCQPVPSTAELTELDAEFEPAGPAQEAQFVWALQHSDATQLIYNAEYVFAAEEHCARLILAAGLPLLSFKLARMRIVYKRPFLPGQTCTVRGTLATRTSDGAAVALIGFHPVDAAGVVNDTPAVFVRFDAAFDKA